MVDVPVQEGDILDGKFRIERVLGSGGMGVVVAARHLKLERRVAIKFLLPEALKEKEVVARFSREARAAASLRSEHVARVTDVGTLESGAPFMIMEYLEGRDMRQLLREGGALPIKESVDYVLQACEAVAEAHAIGIVHRDLKPANLFLVERPGLSPMVKVLDFGISKMTQGSLDGEGNGEDLDITTTSARLGSPIYMPPEQISSARDVDGRADIWSIGVILYEFLTAQRPFVGPNVGGVIAKILQYSPAPPSALRPEIPEGLSDIVMKCLEKNVDSRFPSVGELAGALLPYGLKGNAEAAPWIVSAPSHSGRHDSPSPSASTDRPALASSSASLSKQDVPPTSSSGAPPPSRSRSSLEDTVSTKAISAAFAAVAVLAAMSVVMYRATRSAATSPSGGLQETSEPRTPPPQAAPSDSLPAVAPALALPPPSTNASSATSTAPLPSDELGQPRNDAGTLPSEKSGPAVVPPRKVPAPRPPIPTPSSQPLDIHLAR